MATCSFHRRRNSYQRHLNPQRQSASLLLTYLHLPRLLLNAIDPAGLNVFEATIKFPEDKSRLAIMLAVWVMLLVGLCPLGSLPRLRREHIPLQQYNPLYLRLRARHASVEHNHGHRISTTAVAPLAEFLSTARLQEKRRT